MKKRIKNICIVLLYLCGGKLITSFGAQSKRVRVLALHDIPDANQFEKMLIFLKKHYHIISPEDFEKKNFDEKKVNILLTFDDGYESWYRNVLPLFKKHAISGIFFVCAGFVSSQGDREQEELFLHKNLLLKQYRNPLFVEQINQLKEVGMIGGHTFSHRPLSKLDEQDLKKDLEKERSFAQQNYAPSLNHFAYPFGREEDISLQIEKLLQEIGYTHTYTTQRSFVSEKENNFRIPRTMIDPDENFLVLRARIEGVVDRF